MKIKHETCLYVVDHIYIDQAGRDLYHLFLHCDYCGKPIKLCVRTENNVVNWLGGKKGEWIKNEHTFWTCSHCNWFNDMNRIKYNFCPNCGAYMRKGGAE